MENKEKISFQQMRISEGTKIKLKYIHTIWGMHKLENSVIFT